MDQPACAGVVSMVPIPTRPNAMMYFVFIMCRVTGFVVIRFDEGAGGIFKSLESAQVFMGESVEWNKEGNE